jgi:CubicO group peptidase (beta-lactamase class C family)
MQHSVRSGDRWQGRLATILALLLGTAPLAAHAQAVHAEAVSDERLAAALQGLEDLARKTVEAKAVPGLAIAVVYKNKPVYLKGFGVREVGKPDLVDADTVFQLASLSKPISATVVAALVSEGLVGWDTRISDLDPAFQLHDPYPTAELTIRDLFSHRSGLPNNAGNDLEDIGFGRDEVLRRLRLVPAASSFRAAWSYSNAGFTEGAVAAAKPTGKSWETVAEEKLYRPLGMASTSSRHADYVARANRAELHVKTGADWAATVKRDLDMQAPAGGVSSNARDLAQWMRLELGWGVFDGKRMIDVFAIGESHVALMRRYSLSGAALFYGQGWGAEFGRRGRNWVHYSDFFSASAPRTFVSLYPDVSHYPEAGLGIVVLSNAFPSGVPEGLAYSFADLVFDGKVEEDWVKRWDDLYELVYAKRVAAAKAPYASPPTTRSAALPLDAYAGRYANDYVGDAVVSLRDGALTLVVGPGGARSYALHHFDRDLFLYYPDSEAPDKPSAARFAIGPDGRAAAVQIESLDELRLGTLKRQDK